MAFAGRRPDGRIVTKRSQRVNYRSATNASGPRGRGSFPGDGDVTRASRRSTNRPSPASRHGHSRESGGDRSAVNGGTRNLSDEIIVRISAKAGETFLDRMIALVEGAERQKTPNEIALNILLAGLTIIFLLVVTLQPLRDLLPPEQ